MTVMRTLDGRSSRSAPLAPTLSVVSSELRWSEGDDMGLPDVPAGDGERTGECCGRGVPGEQREAGRRREEGARILPADRRGSRAGQEASDLAEADEGSAEQALDEQRPRAAAHNRRHRLATQR